MKLVLTFIAALISSVSAAPAIVWSSEKSPIVHTSELIDAKNVLSSTVSSSESSLYNVVFVVGRDANGSEGLTGLTSSGSLPNIASKYSEASTVHHYVRGIESFDSLLRDAKGASSNVVETSLVEYRDVIQKENEKADSSKLILVSVPADAATTDIDSAVTSAIEDERIGSVVLTAVRGLSEVKLERNANAKKNLYQMQYKATGRRRLEDNANGNNNNDNSMDGIYFVNFTPNIFSGLLFFFFFAAVAYIGLGCMNMIAGQDVYVNKYPSIGREV